MEQKHEHEHGHDCGCGCSEEHDTMTLTLDNGEEIKCDVIGIFDVEEKSYIALLPLDDDEVLLYKYIETDNEDGFELENIESDEEFSAVENAFFEILDTEDFDDEDYENDEDLEDDEELEFDDEFEVDGGTE